MVTATSTRCTARYPDLGLELLAGVPTPIPDDPKILAAVQEVAGVVIERTAAPSTFPASFSHEEN